ncbi:hypothetical protein [Alkalihalobacterium chitinilyticum]|uniref:ABC transporter permease n=1 Tax=Alkalihalobacterium chitinilyticum TaxID=2980103 RepID=A0ABT5VJL3_9BACI|nr:hypothetical protein [Alkalihalobacterium chitinilyticum]MDE5415645.1 hypothetical protein [Alkalihalobacterium chitinilyticum]
MFKDLKGHLLYFVYDHKFSVTIFWAVLILSSVVFFTISALNPATTVVFSMSLAIYFFCAINGFLMTKETFPFLIKLGSTRNQYIMSAIIFNFILAVFMSVIAVLVNQFVMAAKNLTNVDNFTHFVILEGTTISATWYNELWVNIIFCFLLLQIGFMMSSIFYRLGLVGGYSGLLFLALLLILPSTRGVLIDLFVGTYNTGIDINYVSIILLSLVVILPNWLLLREASTTAGDMR